MAGYNNFSMSNNAIKAYNNGLVPASKVGHGISAKLVKEFVRYEEWHHTSSRYNNTNFYNVEEVLAVFGIAETEDYTFEDYRNEAAVKALADSKTSKKEEPKQVRANVEWIEWEGSRSHPKAVKYAEKNVLVTFKGQFVTMHLKSGDMRKKIGSNGTFINVITD